MTRLTPPGTDFCRAVLALASTGGNPARAEIVAEERWGAGSPAVQFLKAAVAGASTQTSGWASGIATAVGMEFIGLVNQLSVHGRVGLRPAPLNVNLAGISAGATAHWTQEGTPAPATKFTMSGNTLPPLAVSALAVMSEDLLKVGAPGAEEFVRSALLRAVVEAVDVAFLDPANSGVANTKPASLLDGVTAIVATADVEYDLKALVNDFAGDLATAYFVARPETFVALNSIERPFVGARGGELLGIPCIASRHVPQPAGGEILALIDGQGIASGDDGVTVDISDQASLRMNDAPSGSEAQVSMFQAGLVAMKIGRRMNWAAMRPSVSFLEDIQWEEVSA